MIVSKNFLYLTRVDSRVFPEKEIYKLIQVLKTIIVGVLRDVFLNRLKNNQVCISQHTLSKTCTPNLCLLIKYLVEYLQVFYKICYTIIGEVALRTHERWIQLHFYKLLHILATIYKIHFFSSLLLLSIRTLDAQPDVKSGTRCDFIKKSFLSVNVLTRNVQF